MTHLRMKMFEELVRRNYADYEIRKALVIFTMRGALHTGFLPLRSEGRTFPNGFFSGYSSDWFDLSARYVPWMSFKAVGFGFLPAVIYLSVLSGV